MLITIVILRYYDNPGEFDMMIYFERVTLTLKEGGTKSFWVYPEIGCPVRKFTGTDKFYIKVYHYDDVDDTVTSRPLRVDCIVKWDTEDRKLKIFKLKDVK